MTLTTYRHRRAYQLENEDIRVTLTAEGGHIAELFDKRTKINPLWTPPWPSIEPSDYDLAKNPEYGGDSESKLLAGIMGHNLCVDLFGPPSQEEAQAGYTVHGEASIAPYNGQLAATLPLSQLRVHRKIRLEGRTLKVEESVENLLPFDRAIAWQEHATLGPPFVERGITRIEADVARSAHLDGKEFHWMDRVYTKSEKSAAYHAHLLESGSVQILNEHLKLAVRYSWNLEDFPWLGIWEENNNRSGPPWNGRTLTWGIEFGASPFPETRARRSARGHMWGKPTAIWLPALGKRSIAYQVELRELR